MFAIIIQSQLLMSNTNGVNTISALEYLEFLIGNNLMAELFNYWELSCIRNYNLISLIAGRTTCFSTHKMSILAAIPISCSSLEFSAPFYEGIFHCAAASGNTKWVRMLQPFPGKQAETKWILCCSDGEYQTPFIQLLKHWVHPSKFPSEGTFRG